MLHTIRLLAPIGILESESKGSKLVNTRLTSNGSEIAVLVWDLCRLKTACSAKTHRFGLDVKVHECVLILIKLIHERVVSADNHFHVISFLNKSAWCPQGKCGDI